MADCAWLWPPATGIRKELCGQLDGWVGSAQREGRFFKESWCYRLRGGGLEVGGFSNPGTWPVPLLVGRRIVSGAELCGLERLVAAGEESVLDAVAGDFCA